MRCLVLCEPAQSKCTWTFHKSHSMRKFTGNWPDTGGTTWNEHRALTPTVKNPFGVATLFGGKRIYINTVTYVVFRRFRALFEWAFSVNSLLMAWVLLPMRPWCVDRSCSRPRHSSLLEVNLDKKWWLALPHHTMSIWQGFGLGTFWGPWEQVYSKGQEAYALNVFVDISKSQRFRHQHNLVAPGMEKTGCFWPGAQYKIYASPLLSVVSSKNIFPTCLTIFYDSIYEVNRRRAGLRHAAGGECVGETVAGEGTRN